MKVCNSLVPAARRLVEALRRAAAIGSVMVFAVASAATVLVPPATTAVGLTAAAWVALAPSAARAACLLDGKIRNDIADRDCLEAQRTGCVRTMLTPQQYINCLKANDRVQKSGQTCIINGTIRNDLSARDCREAKETGCVRRLLTATQYENCLNAQPGRQRCVIKGVPRPDLKGLDCDEAKATGCVRRLLTPAGYERCLAAQRH